MTDLRRATLPYRALFGDPIERPYLRLWLTGINGAAGDVWGIVDSGADTTSLPVDFASLMGYDGTTPTRKDGLGAGGTIDTWIAQEPSRAWVVGWEQVVFEIWPTFIEGGHALMGSPRFFPDV